jgi:DNA-directed RNA polymerase specialized sigma24 family protein
VLYPREDRSVCLGLARLDPEQRRLIESRLLKLSDRETARRLGTSVRTVERKWSSIRKLFRPD